MSAPKRRRRWPWATVSAAGHVGVIAALLTMVGPEPRRYVEPEVVPVEIAPRYLVPPTPPKPPTPEPKPAPEPSPAPPKPVVVKPVRQVKVRRPKVQPPPEVETLSAAPSHAEVDASIVSEAELASAARAGSGSGSGAAGGGAGCDMARWIQEKLRRDRGVQAAMAGSGSRAIRLWNGDWVRHGGEDGAGLAAVREAIMWEVAWAPEACRKQPVRGLVLLSLGEGAGAPRVVLGQAAWRWSDLLFAKGEGRGRG